MINKYVEVYFTDALRFAQYVADNYGGVIADITTSPDGFPLPAPQGREYPEQVHALRVGNIEIAYLTHEKPLPKDLKHGSRNLYRFMVGEQIMDLRLSKGISVEQLSSLTGYSKSTINSIEHGRFRTDINMIGKIADVLGCTFRLVEKV